MKQLNGFEKAKIMTGVSTALPKGGYIVKIMDCTEVNGEKNGKKYSYLSFYFDVAEGEYKNHFKTIYDTAPAETRKWKGVYNYFLPEEGSQYYEDNLNRFKTTIANFEESNNNYHWDWDEKKLKGKTVGVLFRNEEWDYQGKQGWKAQPFKFIEAEKIRQGKFTVPKDKPLAGSSSSVSSAPSTAPASDFEEIDDDDLPF